MSRIRAADNSNAVSLFPFLAVLICTMGSLLVVLIVVTRIERNQAKERAIAKSASPEDQARLGEAQRELAQIKRRTSEIKAMRAEASKKLDEEQQRLGHLEDHMRRMQDRLASLMAASEELDAMSEEHYDNRKEAEAEIERLHQLIADTQSSIETLKEEASEKSRSYAIVPYVGPNGTHRRPIYIECRAEEVILQPEGVKLTEGDFSPPFGPGNPLASSVRAARDYMIRQQPAYRTTGQEPYPLIIVRPDGIGAFHAVRRAVETANFEFGYQFVDGDWDLKFPAADPELAHAEERALAIARARQKVLAAAAPRVYGASRFAQGGGGPGGLAALEELGAGYGDGSAGDGGLGQSGDLSDVSLGEAESGPLGPGGGPELMTRGGGPGIGGAPDSGGRFAGSGVEGGTGPENLGPDALAAENGPPGAAANPSGSYGIASSGGANGPGGPNSAELAGGVANGSQGGSGGAPPADKQLVASRTAGGGGGPDPMGNSSMVAAGSSDAAAGASSASSTASAGTGATQINPGQEESPSGSVSHVVNDGPPPIDGAPQQPGYEPREYVEQRGEEFSFRNKNQAAVPVRRSIQVLVHADRIAILPDSNDGSTFNTGGKVIPIKGATSQCMSEFGKALRSHVNGWGAAGQGLYWRPVLEFNVGPDGQERAVELTQLLEGAGIELRRSSTAQRVEQGGGGATR